MEKRREKLQMWLNRIARHPVVSQCEVFKHFMLCQDNEKVKKKLKESKNVVQCSALLVSRTGKLVKGEQKRMTLLVPHFS